MLLLQVLKVSTQVILQHKSDHLKAINNKCKAMIFHQMGDANS